MRTFSERGIAMVTTLLVMLLVSTLLVGFTAAIMSDQRFRGFDRNRQQAFYAAHAGLEKLTSDLGNMFQTNFAPKATNLTALTTTPPAIPGITFIADAPPTTPPGQTLITYVTGGSSGYAIGFNADANGNPASITTNISSGPYQGLIGLLTPYWIDVSGRTTTGGDVHLERQVETVAIPVFQFGMFSSTDLSFFAGSNFSFGGRVATNGNLFLAEGGGSTLTLSSNVTAVGEIIRQNLSNGASITQAPTHTDTVSMAKAPGAFRNLAAAEGSLVGFLGSAQNPNWTNISLTTYNGFIRNGRTGAAPLNLPVIAAGGANADIIRRPCSPATPSTVGQPAGACTENLTNPVLFGERYFTKVSLRILLSDTAADIMNLPTIVSTTQPIPLGEVAGVPPDWKTAVPVGSGLLPVSAANPPIARSPGPLLAAFKTSGVTVGGVSTSITFAGAAPAFFHMLYPMTIGGTLSVTCTSTTATTLVGCVPTVNWTAFANGATISDVVNNVTYTATVNGAIAAAGNKNARTLTINGGTAPLVTNTFWVPDAANANQQALVTCTGVNTTTSTFTGCTGVPTTVANAPISTNALSQQNTGLVGGYIKIELQNAAGVWSDVTAEILNLGIAGPSGSPGCGTSNASNPNAVLQLQRLKDTGGGGCTVGGSQESYDYWPNALFDPREGLQRDAAPANPSQVILGGVMYYIALDATNVSKWFSGTIGATGSTALNSNGFSVYFSDRRNNNNPLSLETADYGYEDIINPLTLAGAPNGTLDAGEDVNGNGVLDVYGQFPSYNGAYNTVPNVPVAPLNAGATPTTSLDPAQAQVNRSILFRHALKLVNGSLGNIVAPGLTIVSEGPVYLQGSWNMGAAAPAAGDGHVATSIIADAVTLLSDGWSDDTMFATPYVPASRPRSANTYYRVAIIGGKNPSFSWTPGPQSWGAASDFGTDGGAHNFLRMLEGNGQTVTYLGSIATFFYSRQATGVYKCCTTVYDAPTRAFTFDIDFLNPALLPPLTPVFRDVETLGFSQEVRAGK